MGAEEPEYGLYYFSISGYTSQHRSLTGFAPVELVDRALAGDEDAQRTIHTLAINIAYDENLDEGRFPRVAFDDITLTRLPFEDWSD